jgi:OOP family OmpA-OmpF porin
MKTASLSALSALMLASPMLATAQTMDETLPSFDNRWYVAPFATYTWADEDRGTDDGFGYGFAVGKPINEWLNIELRATYSNLATEDVSDLTDEEVIDEFNRLVRRGYRGTGDFEVGDIGVDGLFFFNRGTVQPFLLGGLGMINDDFSCDLTTENAVFGCKSGNGWSFMAEAGAGVLVPINDYVAFRIDARYRYDDNSESLRGESDFGDILMTAGVSIPLGARSRPAATVTKTFELSADALFGFNKDTLSATGVNTINNFARDLGDKANYSSIQVDGHTDPIGSDAFNQDLSERRANTVRDQLVTDGVPSDRITAQGFGETRLKVTEAECAGSSSRAALIECLQPNRRVEVTVQGMVAK